VTRRPSHPTRVPLQARPATTALVVCASLSLILATPQSARAQAPLAFFKNYFVTGDYVVRGVSLWRRGISGNATAFIPALGGPDGVPATADILAAFLYVQTAEKVQGSGIHNARFAGHHLGPFTAPGSHEPGSGTFAKALVDWDTASSPCWSVAYPGRRRLVTYRVDVLRFLPIDPATEKQSLTATHQIVVPDAGQLFNDDDESKTETYKSDLPRALGASLVVVYRDRSKPFSGIMLYDGAFTKRAYASMQQPIAGFYQASDVNPSVKMSHVVGDGSLLLSERVYLDGDLIATNPFRGSGGPKWDTVTWQWDNPAVTPSPLPGGAKETLVKVDPTWLSDCLTYSAIILRATVEDTDFDGLLNIWETQSGLTDPNGDELPNLAAIGADPHVPDIFAQVGHMYAALPIQYGGEGQPLKPAHTHFPTEAALTMVGDAFANAPTPIRVHFDVGNNYQGNPYVIPTEHAHGGTGISETLACPDDVTGDLEECPPDQMPGQYPLFPGTVGWKSGFRLLRDELLGFERTRKDMFRYVLFGHFVGIPVEACLNADNTADFECQETDPDFHVPRSNSGIADYPGGDLLVTLGGFDNALGEPVGSDFMQGSTIMHEWGHTLLLQHGGVPQVPRELNCKPNYLSVMNYLFQLRGLPDTDGVLRMDYGREQLGALSEAGLVETPLGSELYRTGWYAPFRRNANVKAATKHCDGSMLTPEEQQDLENGGGMMRVDATSVLGAIDWDADPSGSPTSQDINFDSLISVELKATVSDWAHIRLQELGGRRNVGAYYIDTRGRKAVGPLSLDVGRGDIGRGDIGRGDIGRGDIGRGDIGRGDIGRGDIGRGDIGRGDIGRGDIGRGDIGRGGGDVDVGGPDEPPGDMPVETAKAAEGGSSPPPSGVAVTLPDSAPYARLLVHVSWLAPNEGQVALYQVYRFAFVGEFVAPAPEDLPTEPIATTTATSFTDATAPAGTQLAYYVKAMFVDGTFSNISNFATVTTPEPVSTIVIEDLGTDAPPAMLGGRR
jgi:hypothetical protein